MRNFTSEAVFLQYSFLPSRSLLIRLIFTWCSPLMTITGTGSTDITFAGFSGFCANEPIVVAHCSGNSYRQHVFAFRLLLLPFTAREGSELCEINRQYD